MIFSRLKEKSVVKKKKPKKTRKTYAIFCFASVKILGTGMKVS